MDHAQGEVASANGADLDPDVRRFIRGMAESIARYPQFDSAPFPQRRRWAEEARAPWTQGGPAMLETLNLEAPTRHGLRAPAHPSSGARANCPASCTCTAAAGRSSASTPTTG